MGGANSGRYRTRPVLTQLARLDVLTLSSELRSEDATELTLTWANGWRIGLRVERMQMTLAYLVTRGGGVTHVATTVPVRNLACPYGGTRPLLACPRCSRSARFLYLLGSQFVCRRCTRLRYLSQCMAGRSRTTLEIQKIQRRLLGGEVSSGWLPFEVPEDRPKGMRRKTHKRLLQRVDYLQARYMAQSDAELARTSFGRMLAGLDCSDDQQPI